MAGPWEKYQSAEPSGPWAKYASQDAPEAPAEKSQGERIGQQVLNAGAGALRGAGSIGASIMRILPNALGGDTAEENAQRRTSMDQALGSLGADTDSLAYGGGKLATEIAGTAGAGGLLARGISAIPGAAAAAPNLINAIRTAGMTAGNGGAVANALTRAAGGAVTGGVSAGMVNPEDAKTGAVVGGLAPGVIQGVGAAGKYAGSKLFDMLTPQMQAQALAIAKTTGQSIDDIISALRTQGPTMIPGSQRTVPEILQNPDVSQVARTLKSSGQYQLGAREAENNAARIAALERVAPTAGTINEARANAGNAITSYAQKQRAAAGKNVNQLFESVDPFNDTAINLPIDAMKAQQAKYAGRGSFGGGNAASQAIQTAEDIGTEILPAIKPISQASAKTQSLEQAVRAAGGIRGTGGELRDMGIKQSGTTGLINNKSGRPVDLLAEEMHARGFIPDNDPATLFDYLRNGNGRKVFASDVNENAMQRAMDRAAGDLPGAERIAKAVPFEQVQNLRSSLNEEWNKARLAGNAKDAATLKGMISEIDNKVSDVAAGSGVAGEAFPADIVANWKEALKAHADKKLRFDTGPQAAIFRTGADGLPAKEGAEVAPLFWNGGNAQVENMQAFKRLTKEDQNLVQLMKSNATTEALQESARGPAGMITYDKFNKWLKNHSGAAKELFTEQELATLKAIQSETKNAAVSDGLGAARGSPTFQNFFSNGALDNRGLGLAANKIPGGQMVLGALKNANEKSRNNALSELLANPESMAKALEDYGVRASKGKNKLVELLQSPEGQQLMYRLAPQMATSRQ